MAGGYIDSFGIEHNWRRDEGLFPWQVEEAEREARIAQISEALAIDFDYMAQVKSILPPEYIGKMYMASDTEIVWIWDEFRPMACQLLTEAGIPFVVKKKRR